MDQNPEHNKPPKTNNYQYQWLSPLRDIQPSIFGPETASNTDDNPMSKIDSTLFTEGAPQTSVNPQTLADTSYSNDLPVNQLFQWPTMSGYVMNPTTNGISLLTGTDWPNPRDAQAIVRDTNKSVPSTSTAHPQINYPTDPIQKDREPIRYHRHNKGEGDHNTTNESSIGPNKSQAGFQRKQRDQQEQIISDEDYPYTTWCDTYKTQVSRQHTRSTP